MGYVLSMTTFLVEEKRLSYMAGHKEYRTWLLVDGVEVAYLSLMMVDEYFTGDTAPTLLVCDIEVREEYRGRGYSKEIVKAASEHFGIQVMTTGSYTPEGLVALKGRIPLARGSKEDETKPSFRSMKFVEDWDKHYAL